MRNQMLAAISMLGFLVPFTLDSRPSEDPEKLAEAFRIHVKSLDLTDTKRQTVVKLFDDFVSDSVTDAITESLIEIYPDYLQAIEAVDASDPTQGLKSLERLSMADDLFLASDATFYLARTLMNLEDYESAMPHLKRLSGELQEFSAHSSSVLFYQGVSEAGLLNYPKAITSLNEFLQLYPNAPERLRVAAWRQVQQLNSISEGTMEDIYQRMDFSRRKLSLREPGKNTQNQQEQIVNLLARMIKEQQKKEASSQSKNQNQNKPQPQQAQQQKKSQSQQSKNSREGGTSSQANGKVVKKAYNDGPASPWSRLRDRSRDPANNAIKEKLPVRYREIVERYYEAANGDTK